MNPFERLRQAIDKVDITYVTPESKEEQADTGMDFEQQSKKVVGSAQIQEMWSEKQKMYIQKINELSSKLESAEKTNKRWEIEHEALMKEICRMEKNNQTLADKYKDVVGLKVQLEERQRKYKEQVHRVNGTANLLAEEITQERLSKKSLVSRVAELQNSAQQRQKQLAAQITKLMEIISKLKEQNSEISSMLQFNMKKNSDQRRQLKSQFEIEMMNCNEQINVLRKQNERNIEIIYKLKGERDIEAERHTHTLSKQKQQELKLASSLSKLNEVQKQNNSLQENNLNLRKSVEQLLEMNKKLEVDLQLERENVKIKVIEVRNETMELQLEMYKKQCRQLLQQKAIMRIASESGPISQYEVIRDHIN